MNELGRPVEVICVNPLSLKCWAEAQKGKDLAQITQQGQVTTRIQTPWLLAQGTFCFAELFYLFFTISLHRPPAVVTTVT